MELEGARLSLGEAEAPEVEEVKKIQQARSRSGLKDWGVLGTPRLCRAGCWPHQSISHSTAAALLGQLPPLTTSLLTGSPSLKGHLFHPRKERKCKMVLTEAAPPPGHICQPGLMD